MSNEKYNEVNIQNIDDVVKILEGEIPEKEQDKHVDDRFMIGN